MLGGHGSKVLSGHGRKVLVEAAAGFGPLAGDMTVGNHAVNPAAEMFDESRVTAAPCAIGGKRRSHPPRSFLSRAQYSSRFLMSRSKPRSGGS